jgi:hypothetical protein
MIPAIKVYLRNALDTIPITGDDASAFEVWGKKFTGVLVCSMWSNYLVKYQLMLLD